jgi:imidazolonepropionase-like amidohydrolase
MKPLQALLFLISILTLPCQAQTKGALAIKEVNIIDVRSGKVLPEMTVIVRDGVIDQVGRAKSVKVPSGMKVIDGKGKYLMPGMTDAHIHFFQSGGLYTRPDGLDLRIITPYEKEMESVNRSVDDHLRRYLRMGVTTVADVGGPFRNFVVRDSIAPASLSPHVLVTGPLFSMVSNEKTTYNNDAPIIKTTTIEAADSLLARMLPLKPDFIKIWYIVTPDLPAGKTFPVVKHIAQATHKANLKLAVHATQLNTASLAIEAGADILVHSVDDAVIPAPVIAEMKQKKITYIPTLNVLPNYLKTYSGKLAFDEDDLAFANPFFYGSLTDLEWISPGLLPPYVNNMRRNGIPKRFGELDSVSAINLKALADANVNIVAGTDAGNIGTMHASSFYQELKKMKAAGLSEAQILRSATLNPATTFNTNGGVIEKSKTADLLLLNQNPLTDLNNLGTLELVIRAGQLFSVDTLIRESPEMVVQRQLNAYNARNLEAFLSTYTEDVELYSFPNTLMTKGKDAMRKQYGSMFQNTSLLHCKIEERIVIGNKVIDHENVRLDKERKMKAVAIYEVENGLIRKVTFLR